MAEAPTPGDRALVALLASALAPVPVFWGWAPFESATEPPSLPLVVVQRLSYLTAGYEDQCDGADYVGDTLIALHVWTLGYGQARDLADQARAAMGDAPGWRLQQEVDQYEPTFRAWCVVAHWLAAGVPPN